MIYHNLLGPVTNLMLWYDRKPNIDSFKMFICKCFILINKDQLHKFDLKADEVICIGYSTTNKAYRVYNKITLVVEKSLHIALMNVIVFYPLRSHDDEEANSDTLKSNHTPNNKSLEMSEGKSDEAQ